MKIVFTPFIAFRTMSSMIMRSKDLERADNAPANIALLLIAISRLPLIVMAGVSFNRAPLCHDWDLICRLESIVIYLKRCGEWLRQETFKNRSVHSSIGTALMPSSAGTAIQNMLSGSIHENDRINNIPTLNAARGIELNFVFD